MGTTMNTTRAIFRDWLGRFRAAWAASAPSMALFLARKSALRCIRISRYCSGITSMFLVMYSSDRNHSFQKASALSSAMVAMPGLTTGSTICNSVRYSPAPSMVEASISSRGTVVWKKVRITMTLNGLNSSGTISAA